MKKYVKPSIKVIELAIDENIAALVPKTVYKKKNNVLQANLREFKDAGEIDGTSSLTNLTKKSI